MQKQDINWNSTLGLARIFRSISRLWSLQSNGFCRLRSLVNKVSMASSFGMQITFLHKHNLHKITKKIQQTNPILYKIRFEWQFILLPRRHVRLKRPKIKIINPKSVPAIMRFGFWNLPVTVTIERPKMESERERDAIWDGEWAKESESERDAVWVEWGRERRD